MNVDIEQQDMVIKPIAIDYQKDRYPYCIVWTPIPVLTWVRLCVIKIDRVTNREKDFPIYWSYGHMLCRRSYL